MKFKKICLFAIALILMAGMTAGEIAGAGTVYLTMGGAGSGGRWYAECSYLAKLFTKTFPDVRASGVVSPGVSRGNINRVAIGEIQAGRVFLDDVVLVAENQPPFKGEKFKKVLGWMTLNNLYIRCVADMDIKAMGDLRGKKIGIGVRGSGDADLSRRWLTFNGLDPDKDVKLQYLGREASQAGFKNRQLNAYMLTYSRNNQRHHGPVFAARPVNKKAHFLKSPREKLEAFCKKYPVYYVDELGEPFFKTPDLLGIAIPSGLVVSSTVPEEVIYKTTKLVIEKWGEITKDLKWLAAPGEASLKKLPSYWPISLHPGAAKVYKEKGILK